MGFSMTAVHFRSVSKRYAGVESLAVDDLTLSCRDGEMLALLGPSGCGKSSTLKMAAGLEELTEGEIFFDDAPVSELKPGARNVAMVFEDYSLYPRMRNRQRMPLSTRRSSTRGTPRDLFGSRGSMIAHS
jgi:ABC-type sugar transport system ATPase subunit